MTRWPVPDRASVLRRAAEAGWPILQQTAAAAVAWVIAVAVVDHESPFFAPIAAVVGLNATLGRRGSNAVRLLVGAAVGIVVRTARPQPPLRRGRIGRPVRVPAGSASGPGTGR